MIVAMGFSVRVIARQGTTGSAIVQNKLYETDSRRQWRVTGRCHAVPDSTRSNPVFKKQGNQIL